LLHELAGRDYESALAQLRDAALAMIAASPCASDACEMVAFHAAPAVLAPGSAGARILSIDEAIETVAVTRYPHRTLGTLVVEPDGTYRAGDVTLQIAKDALAVFQAVVGFGEPLSSEDKADAFLIMRRAGPPAGVQRRRAPRPASSDRRAPGCASRGFHRAPREPYPPAASVKMIGS
jgi:hypothetical protein